MPCNHCGAPDPEELDQLLRQRAKQAYDQGVIDERMRQQFPLHYVSAEGKLTRIEEPPCPTSPS